MPNKWHICKEGKAGNNNKKDCDYAVWMTSIHRTLVEVVSQNVLLQQLGIIVPACNEA
jgi:hypothetical protein